MLWQDLSAAGILTVNRFGSISALAYRVNRGLVMVCGSVEFLDHTGSAAARTAGDAGGVIR